MLTAVALLAACSTTSNTARLAPERSISINAPEIAVKEQIPALFIGRGFVINRDSDFLLAFNPTTVRWHAYIVTNPGSSFERLTEVTNNPSNDAIQQALQQIKATAEAAKPPAK